MRPLRLRLAAFCAYGNETVLDFAAGLGAHRLFLITGPTGAGKTSVLDGLCYALFGESSGGPERGPQPSCVALDLRPAAEQILRRADDVLPVDDCQHLPPRVRVEESMHGQRQDRVARVQHIVDGDDPVRRGDGGGETQVAGQMFGRMLAVDVNEADPASMGGDELLRR